MQKVTLKAKSFNSIRRILLMTVSLCLSIFSFQNVSAQDNKQMVRIARLVIDSTQLKNYKVFLKDEIEISLRLEPAVISLYAVSEKNKPDHITILEIYADTTAYKSHLETPHFIKYKMGTKQMVKSLELIESVPVVPGLKIKKDY